MTKEDRKKLYDILKEKDRIKKLKLLSQMLKKDEENYEIMYHILKIIGTYPSNRNRAKELLELMKDVHDPSQISYELGKLETYDKNYEQAIKHFQESLFQDPLSTKSKLEMAKAYKKLGDQGQAKYHLLELAALKQDKGALYELGLLAEENQDINKARMYYEKVLNLKRYDLRTLIKMGILELKAGNIDKAKEYLIRGNKVEPNNICVLTELSKCEREQGNLKQAKEYIEKAIKNKKSTIVHLEKGMVCEMMQEYDEAYETYQNAKKIEEDPAINYRLSILLKQSGNQEEAKEELLHCINTRYETKALLTLTDIFLKEGNLEAAKKIISKIELNNLIETTDFKNYRRILTYLKYKDGEELDKSIYYVSQLDNFHEEKTINISKKFFKGSKNIENILKQVKGKLTEDNYYDTKSAEDLYIIEIDETVYDLDNKPSNKVMVITPLNTKNIISIMPTYKSKTRLKSKPSKQKVLK